MDFAAKLSGKPIEKLRTLLSPRERQKKELLLEELTDLQLQLNAARSQFDILTDGELIEACCFQLKALSTRYDCLIREARRQGLHCQPYGLPPFSTEGK